MKKTSIGGSTCKLNSGFSGNFLGDLDGGEAPASHKEKVCQISTIASGVFDFNYSVNSNQVVINVTKIFG